MDAFSVLLAVIPFASYVAVIAAVRFTGRTLMTTSSRDISAMAVAAAGLVAIGPAQLFFPTTAALVFGPKVWLAIALLYSLVITLITLVVRPAIVVYGRTPGEVYAPLLRACHRIDDSTHGDDELLEVQLKKTRLRLRCEGAADRDCTRIVSFVPAYGPAFWNRLLHELRTEKIELSQDRGVGGGWPLIISIASLLAAVGYGLAQPEEVLNNFRVFLWR